jgi:hypothetical protein
VDAHASLGRAPRPRPDFVSKLPWNVLTRPVLPSQAVLSADCTACAAAASTRNPGTGDDRAPSRPALPVPGHARHRDALLDPTTDADMRDARHALHRDTWLERDRQALSPKEPSAVAACPFHRRASVMMCAPRWAGLSLIQRTLLPSLMMRPPKRLALTLPNSRHLVLRRKFYRREQIASEPRGNKRARDGRLPPCR